MSDQETTTKDRSPSRFRKYFLYSAWAIGALILTVAVVLIIIMVLPAIN